MRWKETHVIVASGTHFAWLWMLTDGFFQLHDIFAWQPIRVGNPDNPTVTLPQWAGAMNLQHIVNILRTAATIASSNLKIGGGGAKIEQNCHSVSLSCITVIGSLRKSTMFFGGDPKRWVFDLIIKNCIHQCHRHPQNRGGIGCYFPLGCRHVCGIEIVKIREKSSKPQIVTLAYTHSTLPP